MNENLRRFLIGLVAVLFLAFLWWLWSSHDASFRTKSRPPIQSSSNSVPPVAAEKIASLLPSIRYDDSVFQVSYSDWAKQSSFLSFWGVLFDGGNGLEVIEKVARELGISEEQRQSINKSLHAASDEMRNLQRNHLQIVNQSDSELHLFINPFPNEGQALRSKLEEEIVNTIGEESGYGILELMKKRLQESFRNFGASKINIIGRTRPNGYNEIIEDGRITGFPFAVSFDSMQQHLFRFEPIPDQKKPQ